MGTFWQLPGVGNLHVEYDEVPEDALLGHTGYHIIPGVTMEGATLYGRGDFRLFLVEEEIEYPDEIITSERIIRR